LQDKIIELTLVEGYHPLGISKDEFEKEMKFPTVFYGNPHDYEITKKFIYQKIVQWELPHATSDFSYHTTNLFFK
jgi:hypothetical protein